MGRKRKIKVLKIKTRPNSIANFKRVQKNNEIIKKLKSELE